MDVIITATAICSLIFSLVGMLISIFSYIETQSFKKSTHSVQYVGAKPSDIGVSDSPEDSTQLDKLNTEYSEEVEQVMPWASSGEEDKQLRSF